MPNLKALFAGLVLAVALTAALPSPQVKGFARAPGSGQFTFQTYGQDDGLDSMGITSLAQDTAGFLWVGTELGAFRYDGRRFQKVGAQQGLPPAPATRLWADPRGGIWASNREGTFRIQGDRATPATGLAAGPVLAMAWDGTGRLWAAQGALGLYRQQTSGVFEKVEGFAEPWALAAAPNHGGIFLVTEAGHAELWQPDGTVRTWGAAQGMPAAVETVREDGQGRLWILTRFGLWFKSLDETAFHPFVHPAVQSGGDVRDLTGDGKGGIWVATAHGLLHITGDRWTLLTDQEGMPTKAGGQVLVDQEGSLWYAGSGLHRQRGLGAVTNQTPHEGLPTELVWSLCRDPKGRLWAGTNLGLARQVEGRWVPVPGSAPFPIFSVVALANGGILAAGRHRGLLYVPPGSARTIAIPLPLDQDPTLQVARLFLDRSGTPWVVGTCQICQLLPRGGTLGPGERPVAPEPRYIQNAYAGLQTQDGRLWFTTGKGLVTYQDGRWQRYQQADGLDDHGLYGLLEAADGTLLVSYYGDLGITRFRLEGDRLVRLRTYRAERNELPTNSVFSLHQDRQGRIWAMTNLGAVLVREDGYQAFGRAEGLLEEDMVQNVFVADPDGTLWFANARSLVRFESQNWPWNLSVPAPLFMSVQFNGKTVPPGPGLQVAARDNSLDVTLGFLSFCRGRARTFQVRIDGLDQAWRTETLARLQYLSLPHGAYRLRVRALVNGLPGPENILGFRILPQWYQTWWFRTFLVTALGLAPFGLAMVHQRNLRRANTLLEETVTHRTLELALAYGRLEAQSVTDPLTGLKNRRYLEVLLPPRLAAITRALGVNGAPPPRLELHPLVFLILDIDLFKQVNDLYGHDAGDAVICKLAQLLTASVRDSDAVIRWGGEEFLIVAHQTGTLGATILPERIRATVEAHPFELPDGRKIHRTVSIGLVSFPLGRKLPLVPWGIAVNLADRALYAVKRSGRNGWIHLQEGPAFAAEAVEGAHGLEVPALLAEGILEVQTSLEAINPEGWS
jgi:diguanylate cyclase (GGDEF)-like protein